MDSLNLYERMSEISTAMVEAARKNDWTRLVSLENDVARLRDALARTEPARPMVPDDPQRARKVDLIRRILADDAEVRRFTEPWMEGVKKFLGGMAVERALSSAYGAAAGAAAGA
jgi:flagellar protein FliT